MLLLFVFKWAMATVAGCRIDARSAGGMHTFCSMNKSVRCNRHLKTSQSSRRCRSWQ